MSKNLKSRRNYNTINCKEDKTTQTVNLLEDRVSKIIEICVSCCCPMPNTRKIESLKSTSSAYKYPIINKQPTETKKQNILREIDENFSDSSTDNEEWIQVDNALLV